MSRELVYRINATHAKVTRDLPTLQRQLHGHGKVPSELQLQKIDKNLTQNRL